MPLTRLPRSAASLAFVLYALVISAPAQITVTSPANNATVAMPVWLRAHVNSCNGNTTITAFGYSIDSSPFMTWGKTHNDIDTNDYRFAAQPSPGAQYTIHYKAWSSAGACTPVDVVVKVSGPATTTVKDIDDVQNMAGWAPQACPTWNDTSNASNWFWQWDPGTTKCTFGNSNTYLVASGSPNIDGESRIFYVDWKSQVSGGSPGERYTEKFGTNAQAAMNFVYDAYIYPTDPQNILNLELDTNQVYDSSGDVLIYGLQCATGSNTWEYTTNSTGTLSPSHSKWNPSSLPCNLHNSSVWAPNTWHHVQLAVHRDSSGNAHYDKITVDGTTTTLNLSGFSAFGIGWHPGDLSLNYQIDGIYNSGNEATATTYVDGMTMIYW